MVTIKSNRELEIMRRAGKTVSQILSTLAQDAKAGMTLLELDQRAEAMTLEAGARPAFKGYHGYKHTLCTSVNEQVVHGIPSSRKLVDGDVVGLDFGIVLDGFYSDSAVTVPIGSVSEAAIALLTATRNSLYAAIAMCQPGNSIRDVSRAVETTVRPQGYGVVREFVGHGIGAKLHEDPQIPNYEAGAPNVRLRPGMTICIEPMINLGTPAVRLLPDGWTAVTADGKLSAHYEHTIAITEAGPEVLTEWNTPSFGSVFAHFDTKT